MNISNKYKNGVFFASREHLRGKNIILCLIIIKIKNIQLIFLSCTFKYNLIAETSINRVIIEKISLPIRFSMEKET